MWFEVWQIIMMLALFAYGLWYTAQMFAQEGFKLGFEQKIEEVAADRVEAVLVQLEEQGIIYREPDPEDGEEVIYPVQYDENNNRIS